MLCWSLVCFLLRALFYSNLSAFYTWIVKCNATAESKFFKGCSGSKKGTAVRRSLRRLGATAHRQAGGGRFNSGEWGVARSAAGTPTVAGGVGCYRRTRTWVLGVRSDKKQQLLHVLLFLSRTSDTSGGFCVSCFISTHETPFTARMDYYLGCSIEIGKCGVAHEWFQCYDKRYFEKCPKHYFRYTNSNPVPTHMNFVRKKSGFFGKKLVDHTTSHIIKYSPISILCPR